MTVKWPRIDILLNFVHPPGFPHMSTDEMFLNYADFLIHEDLILHGDFIGYCLLIYEPINQ